MRITGPNRLVGPASGAGVRRAGGAGGAVFQPTEAPATSRATTAGGALGVSSLDALIALQAIAEDLPREKRRRSVQRGRDILDVLDEIRVGLLSGTLSGAALDRVVRLLADIEPSGDEALDALVEDIALRAEVELAKLGRFVDRS